MNTTTETLYGTLKCREVGSPTPKQLIVLCHGYGAPGTDLVPLASSLLSIRPDLQSHTRFLFPEAPISLNMGLPWMEARAWWNIDVGRYERALRSGDLRSLTGDEPDGLPHARALLEETLDSALSTYGLTKKDLVLGGFSQGAMLATDLTLRMEEGPKALCVLSGTLLNEEHWAVLARQRGPLPVFQSHGNQDPILPFQTAVWLHELLTKEGHSVRFSPFEGAHGIPMEVLQDLGEFLP